MTPEELLTNQLYNGLLKIGNETNMRMHGTPDGKPRTIRIQKGLFTLPMKWIMVVWPFGQWEFANQISNCNRKEVIEALRNCADQLEASGDLIKPIKMPWEAIGPKR
jgi:hypothetical protein